MERIGIKVYNPKGVSGTLEKARIHFKAQKILSEHNLAPEPIEEGKFKMVFVKAIPLIEHLQCYGMITDRVLSGDKQQILKNLKLFGVKRTLKLQQIITKWIGWYGQDGLTLADYIILCRYFGISGKEYLNQILNDLKSRMPTIFVDSPDFLSPANVCIDENGEAKVIDCDHSGL